MIDDFGDLLQIIRPMYDPDTKAWIIILEYLTQTPLFAARSGGLWHLPWNGAIVQAQVLHQEHVKTREEQVLEWLGYSVGNEQNKHISAYTGCDRLPQIKDISRPIP